MENNIQYHISDGGKIESKFEHEKLDCTVRAVALARQISYIEAHSLLKNWGRKDRHKFNNWLGFIAIQPWAKAVEFSTVWLTLNQFLKDHPLGTYILRMKGHVFAVNKGCVLDSFVVGKKCRIIQA